MRLNIILLNSIESRYQNGTIKDLIDLCHIMNFQLKFTGSVVCGNCLKMWKVKVIIMQQ